MAVRRLNENDSIRDFDRSISEIISKIDDLRIPTDDTVVNHSISQLKRIQKVVQKAITDINSIN